jgi:hypothetical protein
MVLKLDLCLPYGLTAPMATYGGPVSWNNRSTNTRAGTHTCVPTPTPHQPLVALGFVTVPSRLADS